MEVGLGPITGALSPQRIGELVVGHDRVGVQQQHTEQGPLQSTGEHRVASGVPDDQLPEYCELHLPSMTCLKGCGTELHERRGSPVATDVRLILSASDRGR